MRLGVNVDHVATVREARRGRDPDPVTCALLAEEAGADQITVHLREDRRHIQDRDLRILREMVKTRLNQEMAATEEMVSIALSVRPDVCTLVPERRDVADVDEHRHLEHQRGDQDGEDRRSDPFHAALEVLFCAGHRLLRVSQRT